MDLRDDRFQRLDARQARLERVVAKDVAKMFSASMPALYSWHLITRKITISTYQVLQTNSAHPDEENSHRICAKPENQAEKCAKTLRTLPPIEEFPQRFYKSSNHSGISGIFFTPRFFQNFTTGWIHPV